jgi:hypothetical protein
LKLLISQFSAQQFANTGFWQRNDELDRSWGLVCVITGWWEWEYIPVLTMLLFIVLDWTIFPAVPHSLGA